MSLDEDFWVSLPIATLLLDADTCIKRCNPAAEMFLNMSAKSLVGRPVWDKVMVDAPLEDAFERARVDRSTLVVNDVDVGSGERPPMQCNLQIAPMQNHRDQMMLLISPRELAFRITRSGSAKSSAKSAIGMSEMLAHEIKNPLAGITGAAQLLSMGISKEDQEMTDLIVEETRRISKLLEQFEQFGNLRPPERKPVNIHDILDRARKSAMLGFGAHMDIDEHYDPSLPETFGDSDQLLQVFLNLLKNACEAADPNGGSLKIKSYYEQSLRIKSKDGRGRGLPLQVEIIDDGPGLPADISGDIFDPFVSGRENGTGLGLALVAKIIDEHDGWIAVDSTPGRTIFRVSLPTAPKELENA